MPEIFVDEILRERGYESRTLQVYTKRELSDAGQLLRRWNISYQTVEPTQEFIDELEEPLKSMVLEAQQIINAGSQPQAGSGRDSRTRDSRTRDSRQSSAPASAYVPPTLRLVYLIEYDQVFGNASNFDGDQVLEQVRAGFGDSTYTIVGYARSGAAFDTSADKSFIYHDTSLVPAEYKEDLIYSAPNRNQRGMFESFLHPCGSQQSGCVPAAGLDAFPDDLGRQLDVARLAYGPYMKIRFGSNFIGLNTRLEWVYLQGEKGIRERFADKLARENAPGATIDF